MHFLFSLYKLIHLLKLKNRPVEMVQQERHLLPNLTARVQSHVAQTHTHMYIHTNMYIETHRYTHIHRDTKTHTDIHILKSN